MPLNTAYLALGSNMGRRLDYMRSALQLLGEKGVTLVVASPVYESRAIGLGKAEPFLNAVVQVQTELEPEELLETCLAVETHMGRVRTKVRTSRTIDIDLLAYDGKRKIKTEKLQLPHPRITERAFVLQPFTDIAPDFKLHGKSVEMWLNNLPFFELTGLGEDLM